MNLLQSTILTAGRRCHPGQPIVAVWAECRTQTDSRIDTRSRMSRLSRLQFIGFRISICPVIAIPCSKFSGLPQRMTVLTVSPHRVCFFEEPSFASAMGGQRSAEVSSRYLDASDIRLRTARRFPRSCDSALFMPGNAISGRFPAFHHLGSAFVMPSFCCPFAHGNIDKSDHGHLR